MCFNDCGNVAQWQSANSHRGFCLQGPDVVGYLWGSRSGVQFLPLPNKLGRMAWIISLMGG